MNERQTVGKWMRDRGESERETDRGKWMRDSWEGKVRDSGKMRDKEENDEKDWGKWERQRDWWESGENEWETDSGENEWEGQTVWKMRDRVG